MVKKWTPEGLPQQFSLCIDYGKLNSLILAVTPAMSTKKGAFALMPLSKNDGLFTLLKGTKYFRAHNLCSGYCHIKWDEESIPKSAFTTIFGKFEFLRLPFWFILRPSLHYVSYLWPFGLDKTSNQGQGSGYLAYLDDILIYSRTKKECLKMLDKAFKCLLMARFKIKLSKCSFSKEQIHYLGHLVSGTSILPLANITEARHLWTQAPTNIKEVRHFLGLTW